MQHNTMIGFQVLTFLEAKCLKCSGKICGNCSRDDFV
jgi:hypothetical protein